MKDWEKEVYRQTPYYQSLANKYGKEYADASIGYDTNLGGKSKVRYARVPAGVETCAFCIMLASRGFVYASKQTASHVHSHCDCRVVPGFKDETTVEGYDPDSLYEQYYAARKAVEAKFTKDEWKSVTSDIRTELILREMRKQLREQKAAETDETSQPKATTAKTKGRPDVVSDLESRPKANGSGENGLVIKEYDKEDLINVVKAWTDDQSGNIRAYQQGYSMPLVFLEYSGMIERFISLNENYEGAVWRGINVSDEIAASFMPLQIIDQRGTSSWSISAAKAAEYASKGTGKQVVFVSSTKHGASIKAISEVPTDEEVLISRSARWVVTRVVEEDGIIYVYCKELNR